MPMFITNTKLLPYTVGGGKFWQTMQVKAIGKENLTNKLQSVHMPNIL